MKIEALDPVYWNNSYIGNHNPTLSFMNRPDPDKLNLFFRFFNKNLKPDPMKKSPVYAILIILAPFFLGCDQTDMPCGIEHTLEEYHFVGSTFDMTTSGWPYRLAEYQRTGDLIYVHFVTDGIDNICTKYETHFTMHIGINDTDVHFLQAVSNFAGGQFVAYDSETGSYKVDYIANRDFALQPFYGDGPGKFDMEWVFSFPYKDGTQEENLIWFANRVYWSFTFTYNEYKATN